MKHKVMCLVCGRNDILVINDKTGKITDKNWYYFDKLNINALKTSKYFYEVVSLRPKLVTKKIRNAKYDPKAKRKMIEYWECKKCFKQT